MAASDTTDPLACSRCALITAPPWHTCTRGHILCAVCEQVLLPAPKPSTTRGQPLPPPLVKVTSQVPDEPTWTNTSLRPKSTTEAQHLLAQTIATTTAQKPPPPKCPHAGCGVPLVVPLPRAEALERTVVTHKITLANACPNTGCPVQVPLGQPKSHSDACLYRVTPCILTECTWTGTMAARWDHLSGPAHTTPITRVTRGKYMHAGIRQGISLLEFEGYRLIVTRHVSTAYSLHVVAVGAQPWFVHFRMGSSGTEPVFNVYAHAQLDPIRCLGCTWILFGTPTWLDRKTADSIQVQYAEMPSRKRPRVEGGEIEEPAAKAPRSALTIDLADAQDGETLEEKEKEKPGD